MTRKRGRSAKARENETKIKRGFIPTPPDVQETWGARRKRRVESQIARYKARYSVGRSDVIDPSETVHPSDVSRHLSLLGLTK